MSTPRAERIFIGQVASRGLARGAIALHHTALLAARTKGSPTEERDVLDSALGRAARQLGELTAGTGEEGAAVLEFQLALLEDPELTAPVHAAITAGEAAPAAWRQVLDAQIAEYETAEDEYFRARASDMIDLRDRVADLMLGLDKTAAVAGAPAIYVANDIGPSRFLEIDWRAYTGLALLQGSSASHVAILARANGIPLIVGLQTAVPQLVEGADAILDAERGRLIQDPAPQTRRTFDRAIAERMAEAEQHARHLGRAAATRSGESVRVYVNIDDPRRLAEIDPDTCDGVGLTRTEFLFYGSGSLPGEETQLASYAKLLDWAGERPVTIRTLDAGGDKPIAGLTPDGETNPFLGLRGLRLSLSKPEVFRVQLRALARAAVSDNLKVMLPMVTKPEEFAQARRLFEEIVGELRRAGIAARMPRLGMMVEVPAAALNIAAFDAEFYSIGSNDLVQYVTATGRDCAAVQALHDPLDPGVIELIGRVVAHGQHTGKEVSLCGDMGGDPRYLHALLDTGLRVVSVAPARLARVKGEIAAYGG